MRRRLVVIIGGACVACVLSHASPAAAASNITTTTTNIGLVCVFGPNFNFVEGISLATSVPTNVAPGAPVPFSVTAANFFENPVPYDGTIQFEEHFKVRSATPGSMTLKSESRHFATGDLDLLGGTVLTRQLTAAAAGPSVEVDFTDFNYTVKPDLFAPFTVRCKPGAPVSVALTTVSESAGKASVVAHGQLGACRPTQHGLRSCTQFDVRSSRTNAGARRGRVKIECDRASVTKFTSQHVTALDISNGAATIEATGRLSDGSDATATIVATDGPAYDKLSVKIRAGAHVVCTANGRLDDGTVVLKT